MLKKNKITIFPSLVYSITAITRKIARENIIVCRLLEMLFIRSSKISLYNEVSLSEEVADISYFKYIKLFMTFEPS